MEVVDSMDGFRRSRPDRRTGLPRCQTARADIATDNASHVPQDGGGAWPSGPFCEGILGVPMIPVRCQPRRHQPSRLCATSARPRTATSAGRPSRGRSVYALGTTALSVPLGLAVAAREPGIPGRRPARDRRPHPVGGRSRRHRLLLASSSSRAGLEIINGIAMGTRLSGTRSRGWSRRRRPSEWRSSRRPGGLCRLPAILLLAALANHPRIAVPRRAHGRRWDSVQAFRYVTRCRPSAKTLRAPDGATWTIVVPGVLRGWTSR